MSAQIIQIRPFHTLSASKNISGLGISVNSYNGNLAIDDNSILAGCCGDEKVLDMKCQNCENLDSNLQDFIDGELDELSRQRLLSHLNVCPDFQRRLEEYQILKLAAATLETDYQYTQDISDRLRGRLNNELDFKNKL